MFLQFFLLVFYLEFLHLIQFIRQTLHVNDFAAAI